MKKNVKKMIAGGAGMLMMQSAVAAPVMAEEVDTGFAIVQTEEAAYAKVANVKGEFQFNQTVVSPADSIYNLFGTAATAACASPNFVFENTEEKTVDYYLNVGGQLKKNFQVTFAELIEKGKENIMKCSCAMSPSLVNVQVMGVPLANIAEMAELEDDINAVTVKGSDGYTVNVSLEKAISKNAMLVYKIGGEGIKSENGGPVQLWMPGAAANYFTRQVTDIEFTHMDEIPEMKAPDAAQRAKISVLNHLEDTLSVGDQITFEGYADDFDVAIAAIEFSMDGGETWTKCETTGATADKWVYWYFTYGTEAPGTYKLDVRAVAADGTVSPLASSVVFTVE